MLQVSVGYPKMKFSMKTTHRSAAIIVWLVAAMVVPVSHLFAQDSIRAALNIGCMDISGELHTLYLRQGEDSAQVKLNVHNVNDAHAYRGAKQLLFFATRAEAESPEDKNLKPVAKCSLSSGGSYILLLIPSNQLKNGLKYRVMVIPSGDAEFGSIVVMNYTKHLLHAMVGGDKRKKIASGKRHSFHFPNGMKNGRVLMYLEPTKGDFKRIRSTRWSCRANRREFVIITDDPKGKGVVFKHIVDNRDEPRRRDNT